MTTTVTVKKELDFEDLLIECWSGALDTLHRVQDEELEDELMLLLDELYSEEKPTMTELNDFLRFDDEYIFEALGIEVED